MTRLGDITQRWGLVGSNTTTILVSTTTPRTYSLLPNPTIITAIILTS